MMDCSKCWNKCGAECCSNVPMSRDFVASHKPVREITELVPVGDNLVIAQTASGRCPFLSADFKCTVYKDRPAVCRVFGDESTIFATCSFQAKDGRIRSRQEKRSIERFAGKRGQQLHAAMERGDRSGSHLTVQEQQKQAAAADVFAEQLTPAEKIALLRRAARKLVRLGIERLGRMFGR